MPRDREEAPEGVEGGANRSLDTLLSRDSCCFLAFSNCSLNSCGKAQFPLTWGVPMIESAPRNSGIFRRKSSTFEI